MEGVNTKGFQVLLNKEADRTILHSPIDYICTMLAEIEGS